MENDGIKLKQGPISQSDLMSKLVKAKKVMDKDPVIKGDKKRAISENAFITSGNDDDDEDKEFVMPQRTRTQRQENIEQISETTSIDRIRNSKLPDEIKKAMIDNPIPTISLGEGLDMNFIQNTKRLMEQDVKTSKPKETKSNTINKSTSSTSQVMKEIAPYLENMIKKAVNEAIEKKIGELLAAQQTVAINENLVLKVGDSIFKGKITGVNKAK